MLFLRSVIRVACKYHLVISRYREFELAVPQLLLPEGLKIGDVVKVSKACPCKEQLKKHSLEAGPATNLLSVDPSFKICLSFTAKCYMEQFECDITKNLLGEVYRESTNGATINDFAHLYNQTEDVLEKPDIASTITEVFKHLPKTDLADIIYKK